jgi:hypothetical protein
MLSYFANTSCKCRIGTSLNVRYLLQSTTDGLLLPASGLKINTSQLEEKRSTPFTSPFASRNLVSSQSRSSYPSSSLSLHACQIVIDTRPQIHILSQSCLFEADVRDTCLSNLCYLEIWRVHLWPMSKSLKSRIWRVMALS